MADVKISGLPASTTPLVGTELLPIVQSATTKQVTVANLTAGRATSALSYVATKDITSSANQGSYAFGTLGYSDINIYSSYTSSANAYTQKIVQNTNAGAAASVDFIVSNDVGTASTYYGDFGVTSSGYNTPGQNIINTASTVYLQSVTMPLAIGTLNSNALSFYTNSVLVGAFSAAGAFSATNDASISGLTIGKGAGSIATNTANGVSALASNTSGANIVAVGYQAGNKNTTGGNNTLVGYQAGYSNLVNGNITLVGYQAGYFNTANSAITAVGYQALYNNTTGQYSAALGASALGSNNTGSSNTAMGVNCLGANTSGSSNTAIGRNSLQAVSTSSGNTAVGFTALYLTTGSNNVAIGSNAGYGNASANANTTGSNTTVIGNTSTTLTQTYGVTKSTNYTVATLPSASTSGVGARAFVTDALAPTFGATVATGGAVAVPVYSDGTNWKVG